MFRRWVWWSLLGYTVPQTSHVLMTLTAQFALAGHLTEHLSLGFVWHFSPGADEAG